MSIQAAEIIHLATKKTSLIYEVDGSGHLMSRYYGNRLPEVSDFEKSSKKLKYEAYPAYGKTYFNEPALSIIHANGSLVTDLVFEKKITNKAQSGVTHTIIYLKDKAYALQVELHCKIYFNEDVVSQWVEIENNEPQSVILQNVYSSFLNLTGGKYYLTHFCGNWANEMNRIEEKLENGIRSIESKKGIRTTLSDNPAFILSLQQPAQEEVGECYGGALAWSGNYKISFQVDEWKNLSIMGGINPFMSQYKLKKGERFVTPEMIYTYSANGQGQVSRNFHDWARHFNINQGQEPRPIILNSWEGSYFKFNEELLTKMMDDAATFGVEMFVLDDGWFGNKYPRNDSNMGLGDWQTNNRKLPRGLNYLGDYAEKKGLKFGLWMEPEMVNPKSELAEKHPDWVVQSPDREITTIRNQWLLDLTNPKVQDFIVTTFDSILKACPYITYIKWDCNRHVEQVGSTYLNSDTQTHFWVDYTHGLYSIYERIRTKYPKLIIQACASGGGRVDFGSLKYHNEYWTSDNTDPMTRLYMQYNTNLIYPSLATAAHVSASPNHQTGRTTPLKFRFDVAMTGRLGIELQPKDLDEKERQFAIQAIQNYKRIIRPLITEGDLYRLISPYDGSGWASQILVSKDKSTAVWYAFSTTYHDGNVLPTIKLNGLDANKKYRIIELNTDKSVLVGNNEVFSGEYLMSVGLELYIRKQYDSAVFSLVAE